KKLEFGAGVPRFTMPRKAELKQLWLAQRDPLLKAVRKQPQPTHAGSADYQLQPMLDARISTQKAASAKPFVPGTLELQVLKDAVQRCQGCELHACATQAVFGVGPGDARIMLVGEQPGNDEDIAGKPFVGPAGKLLDRALIEAGVNRDAVYITNAAKHFKFERRGSKRTHPPPHTTEIHASQPSPAAQLP